METQTTTSNPLLRAPIEDLEKVLNARKVISSVAQQYGLSPRPHQEQITTNHNGSNGHNGHRKSRMTQRVRNKIAAGMKRRWAERRKENKKAPVEQTAAAPA